MSCHPIAYQPNISSSALQAMFLCHVFFIVSKFSCVSVRSRSHNVFSCMWGTCNSVINTSHMPQGACTFSFCHTSDTLVSFQYNSKEKSTWNYYFPIFNIVFLAKYEGELNLSEVLQMTNCQMVSGLSTFKGMYCKKIKCFSKSLDFMKFIQKWIFSSLNNEMKHLWNYLHFLLIGFMWPQL